LDRARQLLEEAGNAGGFPLTVEISRDITPDMIRFVQMWQQDLATLNIQLRIEELSGPVWRQKKRDAEFKQVWSDLFGNTNREPIVPFLQARPFQREVNPSRFASPDYDQLIGEAATEMDDATRHALVHELTDLMLEEAFINPVTYQPQIWAYTTRLQGLAFTEGDQDLLEGAWLQR
jgi:ABC-type transport system substrate-binding protein